MSGVTRESSENEELVRIASGYDIVLGRLGEAFQLVKQFLAYNLFVLMFDRIMGSYNQQQQEDKRSQQKVIQNTVFEPLRSRHAGQRCVHLSDAA
ncbi:MAG: hypothetical protein U5K69_04145 [Balneolaceae bacterium]|nr:hypothetical protein [Balneolaceae bacterium]